MFYLKNVSQGMAILNRYNSHGQIEIPAGRIFHMGENLTPEEINFYKSYTRLGIILIHESTKEFVEKQMAKKASKPSVITSVSQPNVPVIPPIITKEDIEAPVEVKQSEVITPVIENSAPIETPVVEEVKLEPVNEEIKENDNNETIVDEVKVEETKEESKSDFSKKKKK